MALLKRATPEESAQRADQKRLQAAQKAWDVFWDSPVGRARMAFNAGDPLYQYNIDVMNQQAIIVAMVGSRTSSRASDPTAVLNAVCREGWEIVSADFPFVMTGQQSRDKFMSSGQNVAVAGTVLGYYVFKRSEASFASVNDEELWQQLLSTL